MYTHTKFVSGKLFLQKLNQGPLTDTGGTTNNYGAASAGHGGVGVSKHYAKERGEGGAGWMDLDFGSSNDGRYVHLIPICWR